MVFSFNDIRELSEYPISGAAFIEQVTCLVNDHTVNSFFKVAEVVKGGTYFSGSNKLSVQIDAERRMLTYRFDGEGILFRLGIEKEMKTDNVFLAYEFSAPTEHSLHAAILKLTAGLLTKPKEKTKAEKSVIQPPDSTPLQKNACKCTTAATSFSGGSPIVISDFTSNYQTHYRYSNHDEFGVYTCNDCQRVWLIQAYYTDRPPYVSTAITIDFTCLENLKKYTEADLTAILEIDGRQNLKSILFGEDIRLDAVIAANKSKCRCSEIKTPDEINRIQNVFSVAAVAHDVFRHHTSNADQSSEVFTIWQCVICKTGWGSYILRDPEKRRTEKMLKLSPQHMTELLANETQKLDELFKTTSIQKAMEELIRQGKGHV